MSTPGRPSKPAAAQRWRRLVTGRLAEMERLRPGRGAVGGAYWNRRRAAQFSDRIGAAGDDPFLGRLRKVTGARTTLLDVGAGAGRFAVAIAPRAAQVTAVDPSEPMLKILRRRVGEADLTNVRSIHGAWPDVAPEVEPADVVFSAHVLTLVADAPAFVSALTSAARRHVFLYIGAFAGDAIFDPFWRHFHGAPRAPGATWVDAVAVLDEMGIKPDIQVVELPFRARFATVDEAVRDYADQLVIPETAAARRDLKRLIEPWLVKRRTGLGPPIRTMPAAILHWRI